MNQYTAEQMKEEAARMTGAVVQPPETIAYTGWRNEQGMAVVWAIESWGGSVLEPGPSLKLANHSPDGFEFGYAGSGPAQLALAILLDHLGDKDKALELYQEFKAAFVAGWEDHWVIYGRQIDEWVKNQLPPTTEVPIERAPMTPEQHNASPKGRWT